MTENKLQDPKTLLKARVNIAVASVLTSLSGIAFEMYSTNTVQSLMNLAESTKEIGSAVDYHALSLSVIGNF